MSTEQAADPQKAANAALGKFFELIKQGYSRCLHYNMDCKKDAIRAHSIQNNKVLDLLQRDNHVIVPKNKIIAGKATAEFGPLGRHQASTFTGLCAEHDTELFKLADTLPLDTGNKEQLNRYAYRAGMREMHACVEAGGRFFALEAENIKKGITKPITPNAAGIAALEFSMRAWRVFRYRTKYFDKPILAGTEPPVEHHIIDLENQTPSVAVSSLFSVGQAQKNDILGVMLTVVPVSATKTTALVSYATDQVDAVKNALPYLFDANADKKTVLSENILQRVENFVLAPAFYDGWSEEKKKNVQKFFNDSAMKVVAPRPGQDLLLF
ncbi:MAG TPA: hypothetical protein VNS63_16095 [Blastocatellia bacterium]|jgi:hypothetical protein|nr:hypothetical protein [Blastocatellia bacterium]